MKKFLSLTLSICLLGGIAMSATSLSDQNSKEKKERKEKREQGNRPGFQGKFNPFEGLNLSDDQQAKLKEICQPLPQPGKPDQSACCQGEGEACCQGEGEACCQPLTPEQVQQLAADKLAQIKSVLTPEQYQQYLENVAKQQLMRPPFGGQKEGRRGPQHHGKGPRNDKPVEQPKKK